jgi:predicted RNase H-like nuclease (RuvC/YqgF family)
MKTKSEIDTITQMFDEFGKFNQFIIKDLNNISNKSLNEYVEFINKCEAKYNEFKGGMGESLSEGGTTEQKHITGELYRDINCLKHEYNSLEIIKNHPNILKTEIEKLKKELEEERKIINRYGSVVATLSSFIRAIRSHEEGKKELDEKGNSKELPPLDLDDLNALEMISKNL